MKTYIAFLKENNSLRMVAIEAKSINEAFILLKDKGFKLSKSSLRVSSCNIDYVSCEKVMNPNKL